MLNIKFLDNVYKITKRNDCRNKPRDESTLEKSEKGKERKSGKNPLLTIWSPPWKRNIRVDGTLQRKLKKKKKKELEKISH